MRVRLYSTLRALVAERAIDVPLCPGGSVRDLARAMERRWPALRDRLIGEDGRISRQLNVLVDGRNVRWLPRGDQTVLAPGQRVDFFPPTAGG